MPDRIQLRRTKGWRLPPGAIVVSRPSIWGNPWKVGWPGTFQAPAHPELPPCQYRMLDNAGWFPVTPEDAVGYFRTFLNDGRLPTVAKPWLRTVNKRGRLLIAKAMTNRRATILARLPELRGHDLACWCPPGCPCHADVLLELANA